MDKFRVGFGYDVHPLVPERKLIIGGISIDFHKGALGHSDADVLLHALSDALLGAAGLQDIGHYFPDSELKWKDADSGNILKEVVCLLEKNGYRVNNIDTTIVLQEPRISDHVPAMKTKIASILKTELDNISIKATTTEHLGYIGNGDGIAAFAVVTITG
ncbi:MAG: 2-C-methyl-D-erythritol 2,4-cyclodiphosphate synthase [Bacteroidales bacterium]|jgi:2-C-methyl-D-erythritol 2,4-cyclodiphosphate synthase|nr:2-C-methyl-D-erythritol 2,4-cyclodiphosphate synthase [Bacteroidales bacterium]